MQNHITLKNENISEIIYCYVLPQSMNEVGIKII